ncbi:hypothetical protein BH24DEI2_BH24DEI2_07720 [soil metagenome]
MLKTIEAVLDEQGRVHLLEPADISGARRALVTVLDEAPENASLAVADEAALLSEAALSDWSRPEEDVAWQHLQKEA